MAKKTAVFDFDGVIHSYTSGWKGEDVIPDVPVPRIKEAIQQIRKAGYEVVVVSTRCATSEGLAAVKTYLAENNIVVDRVCKEKPPAVVYVDDRAICFDGKSDELLEKIENFKPWYQKVEEINFPMDYRMTDSELIKALKNKIEGKDYPLFDYCEIYGLIKRLQTKNKNADENLVMQKGLISYQRKESDILRAEVERLQKLLLRFADSVREWGINHNVDISDIDLISLINNEENKIINSIKYRVVKDFLSKCERRLTVINNDLGVEKFLNWSDLLEVGEEVETC